MDGSVLTDGPARPVLRWNELDLFHRMYFLRNRCLSFTPLTYPAASIRSNQHSNVNPSRSPVEVDPEDPQNDVFAIRIPTVPSRPPSSPTVPLQPPHISNTLSALPTNTSNAPPLVSYARIPSPTLSRLSYSNPNLTRLRYPLQRPLHAVSELSWTKTTN